MKTAMNYGVIISVVLIIVSILFYIMGETANELQNYLGYIILIVGIFLGVKSHRDNDLNGVISYGGALATGTLISLAAAIMTSFYLFVYLNFIDPDFLSTILAQAENDMEDQGQTQAQIKMGMKYVQMMVTPFWMSIISVFSYTFMGFIFSLVTAIFLKKEGDAFESKFQ